VVPSIIVAGQLEAHDLGDQHGDGLAQHRRLGLDPADAPAKDGKAVDHGGVAVGADEGVGVGDEVAVLVGVGPDGLREVFQVHLVADAGAGGHDAEVVERLLAPFQEDIAFHVPLIFAVDVQLEGAGVAEFVDHHRVVDDKIDGASGLICCASPPRPLIPSRIAARSTTAGTPVKSCISTRAGR
jgi:hypothetical protein